mmetsp:Transcript_21266/g.38194  ORF Transcript_21266/g.38194 Transcript_21266/m.38194 type:complete len:255 (+) Transcript_21266:640-1404(+)
MLARRLFSNPALSKKGPMYRPALASSRSEWQWPAAAAKTRRFLEVSSHLTPMRFNSASVALRRWRASSDTLGSSAWTLLKSNSCKRSRNFWIPTLSLSRTRQGSVSKNNASASSASIRLLVCRSCCERSFTVCQPSSSLALAFWANCKTLLSEPLSARSGFVIMPIVRMPSLSQSGSFAIVRIDELWKSLLAGNTQRMTALGLEICLWIMSRMSLIICSLSPSPVAATKPGRSIKVKSGRSGPFAFTTMELGLM